ncbi:MAG: hypothetical protein Kow006_05580 [Gammaproteobacteria bacterium]
MRFRPFPSTERFAIKQLFTQGPSLNIRAVVFVLGAIILMAVDHRQHRLEQVRSALSVIVYPIHYLVNLPLDLMQWMSESLQTRDQLQEENASLRAELKTLKAQMQKFAALEAENFRMRELLDSSFRLGDQVLIAELLAVDLDPYRHQVVINKGSRSGVFTGQPVVDAAGVTGQVIHVGPASATVMLLTDPAHAIPVQVNRNGLRAIALGTGSASRLNIPFLPNNADIKEGDLLISSGLGGRFPRGYPVAKVSRVQINPGEPFATVEAQPTAAVDRSREVLLVWPTEQLLFDQELAATDDTAAKPDDASREEASQ